MALHNCPHSFEQLATDVLPELHHQLIGKMRDAETVGALLNTPALLPNAQACYVFADDQRAIYVGITKNLRRRIFDHIGDDPSRANLALRITAKNSAVPLRQIKLAPNFSEIFSNTQHYLKLCRLSWIEVPDAMSLYLIEPYVAMKLDTHEYNKFDTLQILSPRPARKTSVQA
jgi:hypothetical protein